MSPTGATVQIAILTVAIYLMLGFLRTRRGSGLMRGLVLTVIVGVFGLSLLAGVFALEELEHILKESSGYFVIVLAILFQPELRRGMVHLGENPLLGRLLKRGRTGVVTEVAQAVARMASKRQGALIAFEREITLDAYIEGAVRVDSEVNRLLLETIFYHGSALHDGAVIIRGDRVAGAGCLFPLTESAEIGKSTGTRHRAALGLTEETDAVTVAVSEETGAITICHGGRMQRRIPPSRLESILRDRLERDANGEERGASSGGLARRVVSLFTHNAWRKGSSLAIATGLFVVTHQAIVDHEIYELAVEVVEGVGGAPAPNALRIVVPSREHHVARPAAGERLELTVSGTRGQLQELGRGLGGVLVLDPEQDEGIRDFPLDRVVWSGGPTIDEVSVRAAGDLPQLEMERLGRLDVTLAPEHFELEGEISAQFRVAKDEATFEPRTVELLGPRGIVEELEAGTREFRLGALVLPPGVSGPYTDTVGLSAELYAEGCELVGGDVEVSVEVQPTRHTLGTVEKEIRLVSLSGDGAAVSAWEPPATKVRFTLYAVAILDADTDPEADEYVQLTSRLHSWVDDHLRVFVDVTSSGEPGSNEFTIQHLLNGDWRQALEGETVGREAELSVELEGEGVISLVRKG